jgi:hypothetical protein
MPEQKILEWECPRCMKKIVSLYPKQLDANVKSHLKTHKKVKS